jgi:hypothetical protein
VTIPIKAGETFLVDTGDKKHLFVSLFDERLIEGYAQKPHILLVSFSTIREDVPYDETCEIEPSEHTFIKDRSYIAYNKPRILTSEELRTKCQQMGGGYSSFNPPVSQNLLRRIQQGLKMTKRLPRLDDWCLKGLLMST